MKKQELISSLNTFDPIIYNNGKQKDRLHLGQLIAQCIEMNKENQSFQFIHESLSEILTLNGVLSLSFLLKENHFDAYKELYLRHREVQCLKILNQLDILFERIQLDLEKEIRKAELKLANDIKKELQKLIDDLSNINLDNIISFVSANIEENIDFDNMNPQDLASYNYNFDDQAYKESIILNLITYFDSNQI